MNPDPQLVDNTGLDSSILRQLRQDLFRHTLYQSVRSADGLRLFMREHVFAVWDFMSLLKRLQQSLTCCDVPWLPRADPAACRFINEISLAEESDEDGRGGYASHFELYLQAMDEVGADARPIRTFVAQLKERISIERAIQAAEILPSTRDFVLSTMKIALTGHPCQVAASFFFGREDVIPDMFARLVKALPAEHVPVGRLRHYLHRHIELDTSNHGPLARQLVENLTGDVPELIQLALDSACQAIRGRLSLWNGIHVALLNERGSSS